MIRSFTKAIRLKESPFTKEGDSKIISNKLSEALFAVQERGGVIISNSLLPMGNGNSYTFLYHMSYEENGNYDEIDSYLANHIFNFRELE